MHGNEFLLHALVYLGAAVVAAPLFMRLGLGSVLGYLAAGAFIGPWGLGLIRDVESIRGFAEFGVVMLLFLIGLELNPARLWRMRGPVFGSGALQVLLTAGALGLIALVLGLPLRDAAIAGFGLAMSSTAFALQILGEKRELDTEYGRRSFSILLFQDLAVIPVIALLPLFAPEARQESGGALAWSVAKAAGVFALVIVGGRYLVRPAFRIMAATRVREIVTAFSLFLVFGIAFLMHSIGLSMALGTFLAGALLAESEYRHELETNIAPFEGLLMGLFFIAVGMSVDFGLLIREPLLIFGLAFGLMLIKFALLLLTGKLSGAATDSSRRMGALLCQGGEFAFVLFAAAAGASLLSSTTAAYLTAVVSISMAATPVVAAASDRFLRTAASGEAPVYDEIEPREVQVIIAGYGRVGQIISRILRSQNIPFTALEHSPEQVEVSRRFGNKIYYGDASRVDLLRAAGADRARVLALAIDDPEASVAVARVVREHFPNLKIFARVRNRSHAFDLMDLKAELVTRETYGSSLEMAEKALEEFGVRKEQAARVIATFRKHDEATLAEQFRLRNDQKALVDYSRRSAEQLQQLLEADRET